MTDRRVILIIICILFIAVALLSFYFFKDMFSNGNNAVININNPGQQEEHPDKPSSTPGNITENSNSAENNEINAVNPNSQTAPVNDDGNNISTSPTDNNSNSSENGTEDNKPTNEGSSSTHVPSPKSQGSEGDIKDPNSIDITVTPTPIPSKNMLNVLFLGIDRTEAREESRISSAADTIMLARIDMDSKNMKVLSIPRDTYAYIPIADKMSKINSSYAYGAQQGKAIKSTKDAVLYLLGETCRLDYYFTLDMEPVPDIIDDLGGVEVNVEMDMQSHGVNLSKGLQLLDGKSAYDYIRWRYAGDGDIGRIRRQQGFIKAMFSKLQAFDMEKELLRIVLSYGDYINTDLGLEQIDNIFKLCADISEQDIQFYVLPGEGKTMENTSYWVINEEEVKQVLDDFYK